MYDIYIFIYGGMNINFISYFGVQGLIAEGHWLGHVGS